MHLLLKLKMLQFIFKISFLLWLIYASQFVVCALGAVWRVTCRTAPSAHTVYRLTCIATTQQHFNNFNYVF